jgi:hypothetical protein
MQSDWKGQFLITKDWYAINFKCETLLEYENNYNKFYESSA